MARQDSMATIKTALASASLASATPTSSGSDVQVAPGVSMAAPVTDSLADLPELTQGQQRAYTVQRQILQDRKQAVHEEETALKQEAREEQAREDKFQQLAKTGVSAASNVVKGTGIKLAGIPTPGGILFPLVVLLVFFFLLVPVSGHTRAVWLWMVLSGNAQVGQPTGHTEFTNEATGSVNNGSNSNQNNNNGSGNNNNGTGLNQSIVTPSVTPGTLIPASSFTGVEGSL